MDIRAGDRAPDLERTITLADMVAYAGATWDWHRLHYDSEFARARGLGRPVVDGQHFGALLAQQLMNWLGPRAFLRRLSYRVSGIVFAGETIRCVAEVTEVEKGDADTVIHVTQTVFVDERVAIESAQAEIAVQS